MTENPPKAPTPGSNEIEDPASIRRTFVWLALSGAVLLLPPRQWISSGILATVAAGLYVWHRSKLRKEGASAAKVRPALPVEPVPASGQDEVLASGQEDGSD